MFLTLKWIMSHPEGTSNCAHGLSSVDRLSAEVFAVELGSNRSVNEVPCCKCGSVEFVAEISRSRLWRQDMAFQSYLSIAWS